MWAIARVAQPEDFANAVTFFASDRSVYMTGQVLSVSGGLTMVGRVNGAIAANP
jgi:2-hydroxycyclohexanecarboxyl-CoA dehydrogenase